MTVTIKGGVKLTYTVTMTGTNDAKGKAQHTIVAPAAAGGATVTTLSVDPLTDACAHARAQGFNLTTNVDVLLPLKGGGTYIRSSNISRGWSPKNG